ncbi:MAG: AsmA family protein [Granulosicoccus sp.]
MKILRRCLIGIASTMALICILVIAFPELLVKSLAISVTHFLTDRELHIGSLDLERSLQPRLTITDLAFENADWASEDSLFSADRLSVQIQLSELLRGQLLVHDFSSIGAETHLEIANNGANNWQLSSRPMTIPPLKRLTMANVNARDTVVTYVNRQSPDHQRLMLSEVTLSNDATNAAPQLTASGEINSVPLAAALTLQADKPGIPSVSDLLQLPYSLEMTAGDIQVAANGRINDEGNTLTIDSDVSLDINSLAQLGNLLNQPLPELGPVKLSATVSASPGMIASSEIQIPDLHLSINDPRLQLDVQGQFSDVPSTSKGSASVSLDVPDVDAILSMFNIEKRLPGQLNADATLTGENKKYDVVLQNGDFTSEFVNATLSGTTTDILKTARTDLSVELALPDLSIVTHLFGTSMPPEWGPITASAELQGESGLYSLNNLDATLDGQSKASAKGSIKSLKPFEDMHLDVDVSLDTLREVSAFTRNPLPDIGPMTGTGVVGWKNGKLFLKDANTRHKSRYGVAVVTGDIGDLIHFDKVRLRADAELPDFSALDLFTGFELPDVDRVVASTNLISADALDLSARQLTVTTTLDGVTVVGKGAVESFIKPDIGVDLQLSSRVDSLTELNALSSKILPDLGPLQTTARLKGLGKDFVLEDISAVLSDSSLTGTLTGQLDDLTDLDTLEFDVALHSENAAVVATELGFDGLAQAPAKIATTVNIDGQNLGFDRTEIDINGNLLSGNLDMLDVFDDTKKTEFKGDIVVRDVNTKTLFSQPIDNQQDLATSAEDNKASKQPAQNTRLLSDQPIPLDIVRNNNMDVDLRILNLTTHLLDITDAQLDMVVQEGVLTIEPFSGTVNEGDVDLELVIDADKKPATFDIDLSLNEFNLARAMVLDSTELLESTGGTWAKLNIAAQGESLADILGDATGQGGFYVEDLLFNENVLSIFSSDLINQLVDAINPFADQEMMGTQLLCSALLFELKDGVLETPFGFATEASDYSVVGEGQIDFQNETLELMFNSKPKTGLGISLNRLAGLVRLTGPLGSPSLTLSELGLLQFGASIAAAVASGGVTLLAEGLYNKHAAMSDVCAQALGN